MNNIRESSAEFVSFPVFPSARNRLADVTVRAPQKILAERRGVPHISRSQRKSADMKAKIIITPKKAVVDPQGKTVQVALEHMGYTGIGAVHVGKFLEIELAGSDEEAARKQIDDACHKILSNPLIEDYRFEIE